MSYTVMKNLHIRPRLTIIGLSLAFVMFSLSGAAYAQSSSTYNLSGFTGLKAEAGVSVIYEKADSYSVTARFESGSEETLKVRKRGKTLIVTRKTENGWADGKPNITVSVTAPHLSFIEANSGARVTAQGINANSLRIKSASGGRVKAAGSCGTLKSYASSGGTVDLSGVECDLVIAKAYSGAGLKVFATTSVKTRTDSGGVVRVFGSPKKRDVKAAKGYYGGRTTFETR